MLMIAVGLHNRMREGHTTRDRLNATSKENHFHQALPPILLTRPQSTPTMLITHAALLLVRMRRHHRHHRHHHTTKEAVLRVPGIPTSAMIYDPQSHRTVAMLHPIVLPRRVAVPVLLGR